MRSIIFQTGARTMLPVMLLFSIFLLYRGHNEPGGGFSGGLVAAAAFTLYMLAFDTKSVRALLRVNPLNLIPCGLLLSLSSAVVPMLSGKSFFQAIWVELWGVKFGTPMLFDFGVYVLVLGMSMSILITLCEEDR